MEQKDSNPGRLPAIYLETTLCIRSDSSYRFPRGIGRSGDRKRKACFGPISKNLVHAGVDEGLSGGPYALEAENHYLTPSKRRCFDIFLKSLTRTTVRPSISGTS